MPRRRKKMPSSIRVGGKNVSVVLVPSNQMNNRTMGLQQSWFSRISLDDEMSDEQMKSIALHELTHEIDSITGTEMTERDVTAFSTVLFAAIRDNPEFIAWLQEE
jgi:hypothetical protein